MMNFPNSRQKFPAVNKRKRTKRHLRFAVVAVVVAVVVGQVGGFRGCVWG